MWCKYCNLCNKCGRVTNKTLTIRCSKCGSAIKKGEAVCPQCGHRMPPPPGEKPGQACGRASHLP